MDRFSRQRLGSAAAAVMLLGATGCNLSNFAGPPPSLSVSHTLRLGKTVLASALVVVVGDTVVGTTLSQLVAATVRPREDLAVITGGANPRTVVASISPSPTSVVVPGKPRNTGTGQTSYQQAQAKDRLLHWQTEVTAGQRQVADQTQSELLTWAASIRFPSIVSGQRGDDLTKELSAATSTFTGLAQAGADFGTRRVIVIYTTSLTGLPPAGQVAGDDLVVVTPNLRSTASVSAVQVALLGEGAARVSVLGPEASPAHVDQLVNAGLNQGSVTETVSNAVLFSNGSAALRPGAARALAPILVLLSRPGTTGVINGFASTPGGPKLNGPLSQARAQSLASFFEARGVLLSSLLAIGHGANDLIAPGPSAANRRVVVVVEQPIGPAP